ncbi:MAG: hypothetical protein N2482_01140 [Patescibacteria group bacterium]|nr:hypothetical protein [Patescibacteria group bacterium]
MFNLFLKILQARNEEDVTSIIKNNSELSNKSNWHPLDDKENNFGEIEAQGRNPERALIEKITNGIDAILMKECRDRGIDPESPNAPKTINEALSLFFNIEEGDLSSIPEDKKDKLASLIYVVAENLENKTANFYIFDKGEGQHSDKFKDTFLKLGGNKSKTYFVHGRFGTGSFGVLPNCGDNKYQLILSKRGVKGEKSSWGWTIIRKNRPKDLQSKHAWYEYFLPNGSIPRFDDVEDLSKIIKDCIGYDKLDLLDFKHGTLLKLYNYDLVNSSDIDRDLYRIFNRYLFSPALPFRILDAQVKGHVGPGKEIDGNVNRLRKNKEQLEQNEKLQIQNVELPKLGLINIDIYIAKRNPGKKSFIESEKITTNNEAVFFIRNGQSHGEFSRQFIRDDLGLEYIAKDIAIYIDCTNTPPSEFDEIFPPTRDSLRENKHRVLVEEILLKELREFEPLKEINTRRRNEIISENIEKTKDFESYINDLYNLDPALRKFLRGQLQVTDFSRGGDKNEGEYHGKLFPTFLLIKDKEIKKTGYKSIPINSYVRVDFETDASNDYLFREKDKGELQFTYRGLIRSYKLYNGKLTLKIVPPKNSKAYSEEKFKIIMTRPYDKPLTQEFNIKYVSEITPHTNPSTPPKPPKNNQIKLPNKQILTKEEWITNYDKNDLCEFVTEKNNDLYILKEVLINGDFQPLYEYLKQQNLAQKKIDEMKKQFFLATYISALIIHKDFASDSTYKRETVRTVMTKLGKCLPFILFTIQKKWIKELKITE